MKEPRSAEPQRRERDEPDELRNPVPWPIASLALLLMLWGAWYYFQNTGYPVLAGDRRSVIVVDANASVDGAVVYAANCVACHQSNGGGLAGVFPPLAGSEWVLENENRLVQILLYGINGVIEVKGQSYQGVMPAFSQLADAELAAVLTHIRSSWGNAAPALTAAQITLGRERFPDRIDAWQGGAELNAVFAASGG